MSVCAKPNRTRKPYTYTLDNPNALLYNKSTWTPEVSGDVNFDSWGAMSGFPPPAANADLEDLFGPTDCSNNSGGKFNCNVGVLGLYPNQDVSQFRSSYDEATKGQGLSAMDPATGEIFADTENDNICKKAYDKELTIDFGKYDKLIDAPISVMHKNWGSVRKKVTINGGTHVNNVALTDNPIKGTYTDGDGNTTTINQKCVALTLRGSEYYGCNKGDCTWGLRKTSDGGNNVFTSTKNGYIPDEHTPCPGDKNNKDCNLLPGQKVGACIASEYMLGPGYYEVLAHAPDVTQYNVNTQNKDMSNGYCWAIWTFHYEEHYGCQENCDKYVDTNSQYIDSSANSKGDISQGYCYNEGLVLKSGEKGVECYTDKNTDENNTKFSSATANGAGGQNLQLPGKSEYAYKSALPLTGSYENPKICYGSVIDYIGTDEQDCVLDTSTGVVNHEIDIEIPGSWPGKMSTDANKVYWTPSTWNCNTFLGSNNPALARATWSSQYVIQKLNDDDEAILNGQPDSFLAKPPDELGNPEKIQKDPKGLEFHKYAFNWCVPGDNGGPYVQWYFDDKPIFKSYTQVPTRSSRLVVGGWFPHWTQEGNSDCTATIASEVLQAPFDTAKIFVASITYKPNCYDPVTKSPQDGVSPNTTVDFPQNYDQCGKGGVNPVANGFTPPNLPGVQLENGNIAPDDNRVCNENCPTTKPPSPSKSPLMTIVIVLIVLVVLAFLGLGVYMFINRKKSSSKQ